MHYKIKIAFATLGLLSAQAAQAAPLSVNLLWGASYKNNAFVLNDFHFQSEVEGKVTVGNTLYVKQTSQFGVNISLPPSTAILAVGGGIVKEGSNPQTLHINQGSVVTATAPVGVTVDMANSGGGTVAIGSAAWTTNLEAMTGYTTIASLGSAFETYSTQLAAKTINGTMSLSDPNKFTFKDNTVDGSEYSYLKLTGAQLATANGYEVSINSPQTKSVVITVTGAGPFTFKANPLGATVGDVIWNFPEATSLTFTGGRWTGSIDAPFATVNMDHGWTGLMVAKNLYAGDEGHMDNSGLIAPPMSSSPVPEAGSTSLLLLGLGAMCTRRRRK